MSAYILISARTKGHLATGIYQQCWLPRSLDSLGPIWVPLYVPELLPEVRTGMVSTPSMCRWLCIANTSSLWMPSFLEFCMIPSTSGSLDTFSNWYSPEGCFLGRGDYPIPLSLHTSDFTHHSRGHRYNLSHQQHHWFSQGETFLSASFWECLRYMPADAETSLLHAARSGTL